MWDDCATYEAALDTNYRVTVILNRSEVTAYEGVLQLDAPVSPTEERIIDTATFTY